MPLSTEVPDGVRRSEAPPFAFAFELHTEPESLGPGAPVTGLLRVRVSRDVVPESLALRLITVTGTTQTATKHVLATTSLPVGSWRSGDTRTFEFSFAIPALPAYSYEGEFVSLTWYLEAEAQVLWEVNTVGRRALRVIPPEGWRLDVKVSRGNDPKLRAQEFLAGATLTMSALIAVFFFAPPVVAAASVCVVPLFGFAAPVLIQRTLWRRAGRPHVTAHVQASAEGYRTSDSRDHLACAIIVPSRVGVERAKATLLVREGHLIAASDPHRGERYRAEVGLERQGEQWQGRLPLPPRDSPLFTFVGGEYGLFWELTCDLDVPHRPDLVLVHQLSARPVTPPQ